MVRFFSFFLDLSSTWNLPSLGLLHNPECRHIYLMSHISQWKVSGLILVTCDTPVPMIAFLQSTDIWSSGPPPTHPNWLELKSSMLVNIDYTTCMSIMNDCTRHRTLDTAIRVVKYKKNCTASETSKKVSLKNKKWSALCYDCMQIWVWQIILT